MAGPLHDKGTPRWVKVFGIIAVVLVLLFVVIQFTGFGGSHGPGRHTPSGDVGGKAIPSGATEVRTRTEGVPG